MAGLNLQSVAAQDTEGVSVTPIETADSAPARSLVQQLNDALEPVDSFFGDVNGYIAEVIFFKVPLGGGDTVPAAVLVLLLGATFFTFRMGFINVRGFRHAIMVTAGKYDNPDDQGEVTHFQALTAALSATVGLGNIAGVAIAIGTGGPGATLWLILAGFIGMSSKFVECTLGQKYREVRPDGRIMGGAMYYLSRGLPELGLGGLGKFLAIMFAILCVGGSFAGGNSFQVKMSLDAVAQTLPFLAAPEVAGAADYRWIYGLLMAIVTGMVIIGGIRRIASAAEKIVPAMCGIYVLAALIILLKNVGQIPAALELIVADAFTGTAVKGGLVGVLVIGFKRAAFSNEAGVGSAAIAHAAAKTEYPVREGMVALLGPFIDTVVICTMTALVIVITGAWDTAQNPQYASLIENDNGAALTSLAMDGQIPGFRYVLAVAVVLFAFSTMISWSYYGERCWAYLFGDNASMSYRIIFLIFTFLGSIVSATNVLDFGDLMIFGMAIPNIIGVVLLSGKVRKDLDEYWQKLKNGDLEVTVPSATADSGE
ncbi:MAG TPA: alanine:cation symporter family protein [Planctomycetes bacterium]|nr:alanine:cation symporter family protein [Fuerstiella sp.]HIK93734.1 alanine:cation symporter family protein [Planctomycetota bacterium]